MESSLRNSSGVDSVAFTYNVRGCLLRLLLLLLRSRCRAAVLLRIDADLDVTKPQRLRRSQALNQGSCVSRR